MRGDFIGSAGKLQAAPFKKRHLITLRGLVHVGRRNDDRHLPGAAFGFDFNIIGTDEFAAVNFRIADIGRRPVADLVDRHCAGNGNAGFAERTGSAFRRSDNFAG